MHFLSMKAEMWILLLCPSDSLKPVLYLNCGQLEVRAERFNY